MTQRQTSAVPILCDQCFAEIKLSGQYVIVLSGRYHVGCYCDAMNRSRVIPGEEQKR